MIEYFFGVRKRIYLSLVIFIGGDIAFVHYPESAFMNMIYFRVGLSTIKHPSYWAISKL